MNPVLLYFILAFSILNFCLLIVIGAFLVQFRERVNALLGYLIDVTEAIVKNEPYVPQKISSKTWDEKYEEELIAGLRRTSNNLVDLPTPNVVESK
jgi:hypothetical protein